MDAVQADALHDEIWRALRRHDPRHRPFIFVIGEKDGSTALEIGLPNKSGPIIVRSREDWERAAQAHGIEIAHHENDDLGRLWEEVQRVRFRSTSAFAAIERSQNRVALCFPGEPRHYIYNLDDWEAWKLRHPARIKQEETVQQEPRDEIERLFEMIVNVIGLYPDWEITGKIERDKETGMGRRDRVALTIPGEGTAYIYNQRDWERFHRRYTRDHKQEEQMPQEPTDHDIEGEIVKAQAQDDVDAAEAFFAGIILGSMDVAPESVRQDRRVIGRFVLQRAWERAHHAGLDLGLDKTS